MQPAPVAMRVLVLTADYPPGVWSGIGNAVERQAVALAALGAEVDVLVARGDIRPAVDGNPRVHRLDTNRFPVDAKRFDWIHLHSLALSELAWQLHRRFRVPVAYTAHSIPALELPDGPCARFWHQAQSCVLTFSKRAVFLSAHDMRAASSLIPPWARASVIPDGVAPPVAELPAYEPDGPIVFAGRLARSKGIELLAEIIALTLERRPATFLLAGGHSDDAGRTALGKILARHPQACRYLGWLGPDQLDALYARAALVLVPSLYEPFGLVALEAMRMGAPVLAADTGGLSETVRPGSGGVLIASRDPREWARRIDELLSNVALRRSLSSGGPAYVARHFPIQETAARLLREVYAN